MKVPVLIDDLDETVVKAFGRMPNMTFIVDKEGKIDPERAVQALIAMHEGEKFIASLRREIRVGAQAGRRHHL